MNPVNQPQKVKLDADFAVVTKAFKALPAPTQAEKDAYALATKKYNDAVAAL
jgi:hypothetical protein